ncbi:DUF1638 domain-containing protein [Ensifer soli]|uniref:DUF1638 domain-containing protein n=1 Tax=Ciceribacter sp. sgz301302 TaxID=3342379 RepID=UPI0035B715C1
MTPSTSPGKRAIAGKVHVIACGAIAREVLAVCEANGLSHIELTCLPAIFHNTPEKIVPGLRSAVADIRERSDGRIFIGYADCGTGGLLDAFCREEGIARIEGPHCYSFFAGNADFAGRWEDDITAFFLTDFLARQFEAFVIEPLGLDRHPELRDIYFGHYRRLVYLSQQHDPTLEEKARRAAERLGLAFEHRHTGYGDLTRALVDA